MIRKVFFMGIAIICSNFLQAQKVAHINLDSLISLMPETKTASEAANNYLKGLEQELVTMNTEFESKYKDYMEKEASMNELLKKTKQEDLQQLQKRIQEFQRKAEMDFRQKQTELTAPIIEKSRKGIQLVAKESGYKYVLDTSPGRTTVLYFDKSDDILMIVKKKLDSMPTAVIPGATPSGTGPGSPPPLPTNTNQTPGGK